jgi:hypothetical protein
LLVVRDSRLLRIVKEYAGLIVGSILGIPAIVVLCYFIYLKRLKKYTGTLDVSPRQTICHHKKSERYNFWIMIVYHWLPNLYFYSRRTICSEENELACSPSTCASKTPQPPPFPTCKRYVPWLIFRLYSFIHLLLLIFCWVLCIIYLIANYTAKGLYPSTTGISWLSNFLFLNCLTGCDETKVARQFATRNGIIARVIGNSRGRFQRSKLRRKV